MSTIITAESVLSDQILQGARAIIVRHQASLPVYYGADPWAGAGVKNPPLLTLLDQLIGACEPVAAAIADNAWDDTQPIPADGAKRLAEDLRRIADTITTAASAPDATGWSLPSCTGKELV